MPVWTLIDLERIYKSSIHSGQGERPLAQPRLHGLGTCFTTKQPT